MSDDLGVKIHIRLTTEQYDKLSRVTGLRRMTTFVREAVADAIKVAEHGQREPAE